MTIINLLLFIVLFSVTFDFDVLMHFEVKILCVRLIRFSLLLLGWLGLSAFGSIRDLWLSVRINCDAYTFIIIPVF